MGEAKMKDEIIKLDIKDFNKCSNIWNMERHFALAEQFHRELSSNNRLTYIYKIDENFIAEISLVFDMKDADYTIDYQRIYISRLIVKREYRRQGIGKRLLSFAIEKAKEMGYKEASIGVDLDNYPALKLYIESGFDKVICIDKDDQGAYIKLLKTL